MSKYNVVHWKKKTEWKVIKFEQSQAGIIFSPMYWPDCISKVLPAGIDGLRPVLDGLEERRRTGADQVDTGLIRVTVKH